MQSAQKITNTEAQNSAANPYQSVWVTANAGTGKTTVLISRVLRLLLSGTQPDKILCITYTKAAAAEMLSRLNSKLAGWARTSNDSLHAALSTLTNCTPDDAMLAKARGLFMEVMEAPEGVRILTIHALCQSLLKRFSIEAGVSPYFRIMEGSQSSLLMDEARRKLFTDMRPVEDDADLTPSLRLLAARIDDDNLQKLLDEIINHRRQLEPHFAADERNKKTDRIVALRKRVWEAFELEEGTQREHILRQYYDTIARRLEQFKSCLPVLENGGSGDKTRAERMGLWLTAFQEASSNIPSDGLLNEWLLAFLTDKFTPRSSLLLKAQQKAHPELHEFLLEEQQRVYELHQTLCACDGVQWSLAILTVAETLLAHYRKLKMQKGLLDYDDLIIKTYQLLQKQDIAPWILFKLDSRIDHLLIDESQDNSSIQWEIVEKIADEFFSGESAQDEGRTLFVVGDEKQSIYGFQGADPDKFRAMKHFFAQKIQTAQQPWEEVKLLDSFRSTHAILKLVDTVFSEDSMALDGVVDADEVIKKHHVRRDAPGRVELWPLTQPEETTQSRTPWQLPSQSNAVSQGDSKDKLAEQISLKIAEWLNNERYIAGLGRSIKPDDIMILVRTRSQFFYKLIRSLKKHGVPVVGEDRLKLHDQMAIQDMLALLDFLLMPQDDLSLAGILKSPFFGLDENTLFQLSYKRPASLWQAVNEKQPVLAETLSVWLNKVDYLRPYELLSYLLESEGLRHKLVNRLGVGVHDALNELLKLARDYEQIAPPSLQGFVQELRREEIQIKRDMEQATGGVRVMTIHGSKGLEAPIVILPDTTSKPDARNTTLNWHDETLIYLREGGAYTALVCTLKEQNKQANMREYRRQLYVALTRPRDELYICGHSNKETTPADSWYDYVHHAMQNIATDKDGILVLEDAAQQTNNASTKQEASAPAETVELPQWISRPAPEEPSPTRPLMPSRLSTHAPVADSPMQISSARRGTLIHKLLEFLPDIAPAARGETAEILLKKENIAEAERKEWITETMRILEDERFAELFSDNSLAEVPVTARLENGQVLSGQIDRLVITENRVLILDMKTSVNVPDSADKIPEAFQLQMQAYVNAIAPIYPNKQIEAAILWTANSTLMPLAITPQ